MTLHVDERASFVVRHIHIDPLGGIAGDMFAGAMLDAWPELFDGLVEDLRRAGLAADVDVRVERVVDEVLAGAKFVVDDPRERRGARPAHHAVLQAHHAAHADHVAFSDIRARIHTSGLEPRIIERAQAIFLELARAEATVHGFKDVDAVIFHEVGAMDSVADVVTAAILIERSQAQSWSCGPLPLGSGTVSTAHGLLPIPAPATRLLLEGLPVIDDGRPGERVTPTGAAIVKHLAPSTRKPAGVMGTAGIGWGTKRFPNLPNIVRVTELVLDARAHASSSSSSSSAAWSIDRVSALSFEIDDQSGEDLAIGLDKIRAVEGVVDVVQAPVFGKKGRLASSVRVLCRVDAEEAAVRACLTETTTLGVRIERVERAVLARDEVVVDGVRTKRVTRPDGAVTVKADADDVAVAGVFARAKKRRRAEDA